MAINLSNSALLSALRLSDTTEENAEATRLLAFATETISTYLGDTYAGAPSAVLNEAAIRLCGYIFDVPYASRGAAFANALRNSGAGSMLLPYKVHRGGLVSGAEAVAAAQAAVGSTGNPVVDVQVAGSSMKIVFSDGTTRTEALPSGMGGGPGEDATARDAAATAQTRADDAQAEIDAHEATTHNTDTVARSTARNARQTAEQAQTDIETHEATTHNTDQTARDAAATAQTRADDAQAEIDAHEATTHNTDPTARDAAAAAQRAAEEAAGGRPTLLYEASTVAIGGTTALVSGNVACPITGDLEFYFEAMTGSRRGGVASARIPAARIRVAVAAITTAYANDTTSMLAIAHGANRGVGVSVQENTNYMMLSAQAPGNFYVRIVHIAQGVL